MPMNNLEPLTWPGRTLLRTPETPPHVDNDERNTWDGQPTLPLEPHHYYVRQQGELITVYWKQADEPVYTCRAPLTLVPCPMPF